MKYNDGLKKLHADKREETKRIVLDAIDEIRSNEGDKASITAIKLMEITSLSRATFYKPHILEIWDYELWSRKYRESSQVQIDSSSTKDETIALLESELTSLKTALSKANADVKKFREQVESETQRIKVYREDIRELEKVKELLTGKITVMQSQMAARGITIV
jgi:hypothetical protein